MPEQLLRNLQPSRNLVSLPAPYREGTGARRLSRFGCPRLWHAHKGKGQVDEAISDHDWGLPRHKERRSQ